jgi:hypothetical protein
MSKKDELYHELKEIACIQHWLLDKLKDESVRRLAKNVFNRCNAVMDLVVHYLPEGGYDVENEKFPLVVFASHSTSLFSFLIRWRTNGMYNHAMLQVNAVRFASQGVVAYDLVPVRDYKKRGNRLKFIHLNINEDARKAVFESISEKLQKSKIKRRYDFLGIIGQAIGFKWLNNPWTHFCSEDIVHHIKKAIPYIKEDEEHTFQAILNLPKHGSPAEVNEYMKKLADVFVVVNRWSYD